MTPNETAVLAACRAHAPQFDRMDPTIQKYALAQMQDAISAYLSSIGGVVCAREPVAYMWHHHAYEDRPHKRPLSEKDVSAGFTAIPLHTSIEAGNGGDGWNHDMGAAPKDKTPVIIAVPTKNNDYYIVGEAYFDPEHYGDGDWWWAGNGYDDYHGGPISEINYHGPSAWRPLPSPPSSSNEGGKP